MSEHPFPTVTGFLTPTYLDKDRQNGGWLNAFADPADIARITAGYACGNCCATFSMYMSVCPICHTTRDVNLDVKAAPADWQAFYDEHNYGTGDGKGGATPTNTVDQALAAIAANPDIDQVNLSRKPTKWGRGRPR